MASREYRAVFTGSALAWFGENAARAAVTALVLQRTDSVGVSAATFAISFLPWLGIGQVLAAIAERYSYRRVMILCDVLRMALMALVAVPNAPIIVLIGLLFATSLLNPPFEAARSALLPRILEGDRYIVGLTTQKTVAQTAQIFGYLFGATIATFDARLAVLANAATFGLSAFFVRLGVRERPPALAVNRRSSILRETAEGFTLVFQVRVLRAIALVTFLSSFFTILPEGLAAGWAAHLTTDTSDRGWYQGVIMVSFPIGYVLGGLVIGRYTAPSRRIKFVRPFAVLSSLVLVPSLADPDLAVIAVMNTACGFAVAGMLPALNGLFVQALPDEFRARAFGVMQGGLQVVQGLAVVLSGVLCDWISLPLVVGGWSLVGVAIMFVLAVRFPGQRDFDAAIDEAGRANARNAAATETPGTAPRPVPADEPHPQPAPAEPYRPPAHAEIHRPPAPRRYPSGESLSSGGAELRDGPRDIFRVDDDPVTSQPERHPSRVFSPPGTAIGRHRRC